MTSGLILLNKKPGITSFDALRDIERTLGTGKVGHTGTLDKFASGLLVVLVGKALKLSQWFTNCDKKYRGKIQFGIETDTLDPEGSIIAEAKIPAQEEVEKVLSQFTGEIMQIPPVYSAIHLNGKRASELARAGIIPEMKKRPITVYQIELLSWQPPFADIFVYCSSGTYIRSLARDIAIAAGSRGYLRELIRTQVGGFKLETAIQEGLLPINKDVFTALGMPWFEVTQDEAIYITHGKPLGLLFNGRNLFSATPLSEDQPIAVFNGEALVAIVEKTGGKWTYGCVL